MYCCINLILSLSAVFAENMNGAYIVSGTKQYSTDFSARGDEYFDTYSPLISTLYSQVYWIMQDPVPIPPELVKRFDGKAMAITGFECDQVFKTPNGDVHVPISQAYNHHFEVTITGKNSQMVKVPWKEAKEAMGGHHGDYVWEAQVMSPDEESGNPSSQGFSGGNGGEYRLSYHGYPTGFAQVVQSPTKVYFQPMQIDTWNRTTDGTSFAPGPVPKASLAPSTGPDAIYSGLLECPCTDRITRILEGAYTTQMKDQCKTKIDSSVECFHASQEEISLPSGTKFTTQTVSSADLPAGCTVSLNGDKATVTFNNASSNTNCGGTQISEISGMQKSLVTMHLTVGKVVNMTLVGPSDVWFGVGFNAAAMKDKPYTIVVNGHGDVSEVKLDDHLPGRNISKSITVVSNTEKDGMRTVVLTRPLQGATADHYTFSLSQTNLNFINAVGNGPYYAYHKSKETSSISLLPQNAPICVCTDKDSIPFGKGYGTLIYDGKEKVGHHQNCRPEPYGDLLRQKNPTCDIRTYSGGQICCHHMWSLLDKDQEIPWKDKPLEYHLKFRWWFKEWDSSIQNVNRFTWSGEAGPVEYDVPQCAPGTPTEMCVHVIKGEWTVGEMVRKSGDGAINLITAHGHCHAPTCLSFDMYIAETGQLLCHQEAVYGTGKGFAQEEGYIAIPPCVWGDPKIGLPAPIRLPYNMTLLTVKTTNSTHAHHGEMAHWQLYGVFLD